MQKKKSLKPLQTAAVSVLLINCIKMNTALIGEYSGEIENGRFHGKGSALFCRICVGL